MKSSKIAYYVILFIAIVSLSGAIYLYMQKSEKVSELAKLDSEFKALETSYFGITDQLLKEQEKVTAEKNAGKYKTYTHLSACDLALSYPDESVQLDNLRSWRLSTETIKKSGDSDKSPMIGGTRYTLILRNDLEASGYVSSYIGIECKDNTESNFTTSTFSKSYIDEVKRMNSEMVKVLGAGVLKPVAKVEEGGSRWGVDTNKSTIRRVSAGDSYQEEGYLFVVDNKIYYIYSFGASTDKKVVNSTKAILDSIYLYK